MAFWWIELFKVDQADFFLFCAFALLIDWCNKNYFAGLHIMVKKEAIYIALKTEIFSRKRD